MFTYFTGLLISSSGKESDSMVAVDSIVPCLTTILNISLEESLNSEITENTKKN